MPRNELGLSGIQDADRVGIREDGLRTVIQYAIPTFLLSCPAKPVMSITLSMADEWYIDSGGAIEGPLSVAELRERAASGQLQPTDSVSSDRGTWVPASSVEGLPFAAPVRAPLTETVVSGSIHADDVLPDGSPSAVPLVTIPGYRLLDTLGAGACAVIYKALHEKLNRVVALKTVLMPDKASRDLMDRFAQEAISLARLHHPNIVAVYDCGMCETPKGQAYFAMELLDGEDIAARLERLGPLGERTAWLIARQTAAALAHAATHGVIHRDVKPANLFLVSPPTGFPLPPDVPMVKVTDFGLALTRGGMEGDQRQTAAGVLLGTPVYMAPEQFTGSNVDIRADIYSLGATMYHILTGQPPFDGRSVWEVMMRKSSPAPRLQLPISEASANLVAAMMATDAKDRPADYVELLARIDALPCLEGTLGHSGMIAISGCIPPSMVALSAPVKPLPAPAKPQATSVRKRWRIAAAAVALVGVGIGIAALAGAFKQPAEPQPALKEEPPATYTTGTQELLYVDGSLDGWTPAGGVWRFEKDDEKAPVLAGHGGAVRTLRAWSNFRVVISLDPHKCNTVEVQLATTEGANPTCWLVRLDRAAGTATFGKRVGEGAFAPVGNAMSIPTRQQLKDESRTPYLEVKYERAGGKLTAWFRGQLLGSTPAAGLRTSEFRLQATGGIVRIDFAAIEELIDKK